MRFWQSFMRRLFNIFVFFIGLSFLLSVWTCIPFAKKCDVVIQNGFVIDGSGNIPGMVVYRMN